MVASRTAPSATSCRNRSTRGARFSVRAYDADAMLVDAEVVGGEELADRARVLLRDGVAFLHAHFAGPGCFAFRIERAG